MRLQVWCLVVGLLNTGPISGPGQHDCQQNNDTRCSNCQQHHTHLPKIERACNTQSREIQNTTDARREALERAIVPRGKTRVVPLEKHPPKDLAPHLAAASFQHLVPRHRAYLLGAVAACRELRWWPATGTPTVSLLRYGPRVCGGHNAQQGKAIDGMMASHEPQRSAGRTSRGQATKRWDHDDTGKVQGGGTAARRN